MTNNYYILNLIIYYNLIINFITKISILYFITKLYIKNTKKHFNN